MDCKKAGRNLKTELFGGGNNKSVCKAEIKFVKNHLLKLMSGFWAVYIIFVPLSIWFGTPFWETYNNNFLYGLLDFLGISFLFGTPTINATWWFMSPIIVFYLIFPLLHKVLDYCGEILLAVSACVLSVPIFYRIPGQISTWLFSFVIGMYFSKNSIFEKICIRVNTIPKKYIFTFCAILATALIRMNNSDLDFAFAFAIIVFSFLVLSRIPILNTVLEHLGKHSGAIFMFHTFIFSLYFKDFIYWFKYAPLIFIVMTAVCYLIAVGLEWLKKIARYDKLVQKVCR